MNRFRNLFAFILMLVIAVIVYFIANDFFLAFYSFAGLMMFYFGLKILLAYLNDKKKREQYD
ncbi:hypothetical protein FHP05_03660 [Cerasibacillus terrae]|uniref:Uncharacterized protein n=1 Tax=Cerasibacillus terrae TaxID=2498845 RepID=A0A5C8NZK5_9BACI|nr:hypothetical protein [Cerasibacillus terrae]TXL66492.1 hypothetical protein FHP05_03660 [Cerasibacillus terrae]